MTKKTATTKTATRTAGKSVKRPSSKAREIKPRAKATTAKKEKATKLSAIDAAAKVLAESKEPLTTKQMIEQMAKRKLWVSPGGKTPERTLYSAVLREINTRGKEARFQKTERGKFTSKA